jgi:hypothetical protein
MYSAVLLSSGSASIVCGGPPRSLYGWQIDEVARILRRFKSDLRIVRHMIVPAAVR